MRRLFLLAAMLLASCRSPEPSYFTLAPIRGTGQPGAPALIELRRPGIAGYLDRSEIVRANSPYQLQLNSGERWGEPFGDMLARVLAEDLNSRLPGSSVFTSAGAISADTGARIEMDVQRFDSDAGGQVQLLAQVAITGANRSAATARTIRISVVPASKATADYVAALSRALAQASDEIAAQLRRAR